MLRLCLKYSLTSCLFLIFPTVWHLCFLTVTLMPSGPLAYRNQISGMVLMSTLQRYWTGYPFNWENEMLISYAGKYSAQYSGWGKHCLHFFVFELVGWGGEGAKSMVPEDSSAQPAVCRATALLNWFHRKHSHALRSCIPISRRIFIF